MSELLKNNLYLDTQISHKCKYRECIKRSIDVTTQSPSNLLRGFYTRRNFRSTLDDF